MVPVGSLMAEEIANRVRDISQSYSMIIVSYFTGSLDPSNIQGGDPEQHMDGKIITYSN